MVGYAQGCHKCGGFPGSKSKDRSFLSECMQCGTFTCNHHLTIMGHCPNCKSGKMKKVLTQADVKRKASGGMPGAIKGKGGKKSSGGINVDAGGTGSGGGMPSGGSGGGGVFQRGGSEVPRSSGGASGLNYSPGAAAPDSVKQTAKSVIQEVTESAATPGQSTTSMTSSQGLGEYAADELSSDTAHENSKHIGHITLQHDGASVSEQDLGKVKVDKDDLDDEVGASYFTAEDDLNTGADSNGDDVPADDDDEDNMVMDEEYEDTDEEDDDGIIDPLDDLFDEGKQKAVIINTQKHQDEVVATEDEPEEEEEDLSDIVLAKDDLSPEERALIEEELAAAAERRAERMAGHDTVKYLQQMAETPIKKIIPTINYVDALWGIPSVSAEKDIQAYEDMIHEVRESFEKDEKSPRLLMGMVSFEPQADNTLNKSVIGAIKSMEEIYCLIGFGPRTVRYVKSDKLELQLKSLISSTDQVLGLGLIGLDMHYAPYTLEQQKLILHQQLMLAKELNLLAYIYSEKADKELVEFMSQYHPSQLPRMVYTGLLSSDEIMNLVAQYDMHLCLRPELSYETNVDALERTKTINSVRWLPCSGMPHSASALHSGQWNHIKFIPDNMNKFFTKVFGRKDHEQFMSLVVSNWARLVFGEPLDKENPGKEDIWADYDPNQKLF